MISSITRRRNSSWSSIRSSSIRISTISSRRKNLQRTTLKYPSIREALAPRTRAVARHNRPAAPAQDYQFRSRAPLSRMFLFEEDVSNEKQKAGPRESSPRLLSSVMDGRVGVVGQLNNLRNKLSNPRLSEAKSWEVDSERASAGPQATNCYDSDTIRSTNMLINEHIFGQLWPPVMRSYLTKYVWYKRLLPIIQQFD